MLIIQEVAQRFRTSPSTLRYWRHLGIGPAGIRVGRRVLYDETKCDRWWQSNVAVAAGDGLSGSVRVGTRTGGHYLPEAAATACVEFLFGPLADDPRRVGAPLRAPFIGQWRARRGEYRVRYRVDDANRMVYMLDIDHRRDAYRN